MSPHSAVSGRRDPRALAVSHSLSLLAARSELLNLVRVRESPTLGSSTPRTKPRKLSRRVEQREFSPRSVVFRFLSNSARRRSLLHVCLYMALLRAPAAANVAADADLGDVAMLDGNTIKVFWPQTRDDGVTKMRERLGTV